MWYSLRSWHVEFFNKLKLKYLPTYFNLEQRKLDLRCNMLYSFRQQKIGLLQLTAKRSNNCCNKIAMECTAVSGDKIAMTSTRLRFQKGAKYFLKSPFYFYALTLGKKSFSNIYIFFKYWVHFKNMNNDNFVKCNR